MLIGVGGWSIKWWSTPASLLVGFHCNITLFYLGRRSRGPCCTGSVFSSEDIWAGAHPFLPVYAAEADRQSKNSLYVYFYYLFLLSLTFGAFFFGRLDYIPPPGVHRIPVDTSGGWVWNEMRVPVGFVWINTLGTSLALPNGLSVSETQGHYFHSVVHFGIDNHPTVSISVSSLITDVKCRVSLCS